MQRPDLTASRWASPEVRRERDFHTAAATRTRTPSPQKPAAWKTDPATTGRQNYTPHTSFGPPGSPSKLPSSDPTRSTAAPLSSAQRLYLTRQTELQRFRRLFRRLVWKANSLTHWSHRALSLAQEHQSHQQHTPVSHGHPEPRGHDQHDRDPGPRTSLGRYEMVIDPIEAERQFKIDFYEFYVLLERALVCLLGVWGIVITSSGSTGMGTTDPAPKSTSIPVQAEIPGGQPQPSIIGDSRTFHGAAHRFHANVLLALDHPSNPLHSLLGVGHVRAYIGVAKEFRNKWKDVEQRPDDSFVGPDRAEETWDRAKVKRYEMVLRDLRLDELLGAVLQALEEAGRRAEGEVLRLEASAGGVDGRQRGETEIAGGADDGDLDMEDAPFEVMTDRPDFDYEMKF